MITLLYTFVRNLPLLGDVSGDISDDVPAYFFGCVLVDSIDDGCDLYNVYVQ